MTFIHTSRRLPRSCCVFFSKIRSGELWRMCTLLPAVKLHNQSVRWSLRAGLRLYFILLIEYVYFLQIWQLWLSIISLENEFIFSFTILYSAPSLLLRTVCGSFFCLFVVAMSRSTTQSSIYWKILNTNPVLINNKGATFTGPVLWVHKWAVTVLLWAE